MAASDESLSIKGTPLSGRPWKKEARPRRALARSSGELSAEERNRQKWAEAQAHKKEMKELAAESKEALRQAREQRLERSRKLREKRAKKQANEIKSAGNQVVLVNNKKVAKMSKKARRKLTKITPEMANILLRRH
ncbi:rRNA-processing CGR1, putative [Babesia caballi]|uniref:rRNA-processing CGR1, putative n=1 Tax=Babesia caballi TaxID=5871 RepID=A0AAV4M1D0_BABCB|nr:rRNA-processing CGR1, putative [Babesia caballi]